MADPLIDSHEVSPGVYTLGTPLTPISIRDQMVRGRWLVDRLLGSKILRPGYRVAVIGAGAGGATAAMRAADLGLRVQLIEQQGAPFTVQAGASTRWIDPAQYDWPSDHWQMGRFPWGSGPRMPLGFGAGFASRLATVWTVALARAVLRSRGLLTVSPMSTVTGLTPTARGFVLSLKTTPMPGRPVARTRPRITRPVQAVIWAVGHGMERHTLPNARGGVFSSRPFWSADKLTATSCGNTTTSTPNVLVIGAGDGALQDFIRAATGKISARDVIALLPIPDDVLVEAASIGMQTNAALISSSSATDDRRIHQLRHSKFVDVVKRYLARSPPTIPLRGDVGSVTLTCSEDYFTAFYGLNCFVALLLLAQSAGTRRLSMQPHLSAKEIDDSSPRRIARFVTKAGLPHAITADEVVIRIGINPASAVLPIPASRLNRTRHHLPFHIP